MYFILKNKTDDLKSKTNSRFRPFSNKIEKKVSRISISRPQNFKTKNKKRRLVIAIYINLRMNVNIDFKYL